MQEALAGNDRLDEVAQSLFGVSYILADSVDGWPVADFDFAAERVGHQVLCEAASE